MSWEALATTLYALQRTQTRIRVALQYGTTHEGYVRRVEYDRDRPELHPYMSLNSVRFGSFPAAAFRDIVSVVSVSVPNDILNPSKGMTTEQVYYEAPQDMPSIIRAVLTTPR